MPAVTRPTRELPAPPCMPVGATSGFLPGGKPSEGRVAKRDHQRTSYWAMLETPKRFPMEAPSGTAETPLGGVKQRAPLSRKTDRADSSEDSKRISTLECREIEPR